MKDVVVVATLVVAFALLITAHVAIAFGLLRRRPWWRGPASFVVAPLAPYWAWQEHMRVRAGLWLFALVIYVVALVIARY
ncbi:MAG: hypothetical protein FWD69_13460 [Polyangiaceae bacterium]|nr:hypothetical protein [Polyangiaceae bacterium]